MRKTSVIVLAMLGLAQASKTVEMTNPEYISSMSLATWKLFSQEERLELYKRSEHKVNKFQS